jgi:Leu/Phe-tRNA-protein transferase
MQNLPAPRGEKSFAGGLRGSFLLASLPTRALAWKGPANFSLLLLLPLVLSASSERVVREGTFKVFVEDDFEQPASRTIFSSSWT